MCYTLYILYCKIVFIQSKVWKQIMRQLPNIGHKIYQNVWGNLFNQCNPEFNVADCHLTLLPFGESQIQKMKEIKSLQFSVSDKLFPLVEKSDSSWITSCSGSWVSFRWFHKPLTLLSSISFIRKDLIFMLCIWLSTPPFNKMKSNSQSGVLMYISVILSGCPLEYLASPDNENNKSTSILSYPMV